MRLLEAWRRGIWHGATAGVIFAPITASAVDYFCDVDLSQIGIMNYFTICILAWIGVGFLNATWWYVKHKYLKEKVNPGVWKVLKHV